MSSIKRRRRARWQRSAVRSKWCRMHIVRVVRGVRVVKGSKDLRRNNVNVFRQNNVTVF